MTKQSRFLFSIPYFIWLLLFVVTPLGMIFYKSFFDINGQVTLGNYTNYFASGNYLEMTFNSVWYALLKAYAFIGIFSQTGTVNNFLSLFGLAPQEFLFTDFSFLTVAAYIELPFMILPIFNSIEELPGSLIAASRDLGATKWDTFRRVIFPLTMNGVRSGVQAVFIPSLSLFMLTRLIGGNRVITLGTAVEQHFLVTQNWGMGSTIGVVLIVAMIILMFITRDRRKGGVSE